MEFQCLLCNYGTERKNNLKKHIITNKHKIQLRQYLKNSTNEELDFHIQMTEDYITYKSKKNKKDKIEELDEIANIEYIVLYQSKTNFNEAKTSATQSSIIESSATQSSKKSKKEKKIKQGTKTTTTNTVVLDNSLVKTTDYSNMLLSIPYYCDICGERFTRIDNLKRHKQDNCKKKGKAKRETKELLQARIEQLQSRLEMETEHFRGILSEKERLIGVLREKHKHITHAHFQVIQNNIINMNPIKFLNTYCNNNPTLKEVVLQLDNSDINEKHIQTIQDAYTLNKPDIIGKTINDILKNKNKKIIQEDGHLLGVGTCNQIIFCNDGSARKFITKGEPGWDYYSNDAEIDKATQTILSQSADATKNKKLLMNKTDRKLVNTAIKRENDWNSTKDTLIQEILGDETTAVICFDENEQKSITHENEHNQYINIGTHITSTGVSVVHESEEIDI